MTTHELEAARYGNMARVAMNFYITKGSIGELDAAYWYARYAHRHANRVWDDGRKAQGFKSQEHLDAFYAHFDHAQECPTCSRVGGYMPLDDQYQS